MAIFRQLLYDEWASGPLTEPLARTEVDEKNGFGMIERKAVREAASQFHPKHRATSACKHRNLSHVEQERVLPMHKDHGTEQRDVDVCLECSLALGWVAAETRGRVAACRRRETFRG